MDPSSLPRYVQISEVLIREMHAGRLLDGERLPPEREMAQDMGVSMGTMRKALTLIEHKGLLQRVQGSGNYVRYRSDVDSVYALFRLELIKGGGLPTAEILSFDHMKKAPNIPEFGQSTVAYRIRRLRRLGGIPAALEEIWLDGSVATDISVDQILESLYLFYRNTLALWISRAEDRLAAAAVPDWTVPAFAPKAGACAGFIERFSWSQYNQVIEYSQTWFDSDVVRYVSRLK